MATSLRSSLAAQLQAAGAAQTPGQREFLSGACHPLPQPSDFTAYFDLVALADPSVARPGLLAEQAVRRAALVHSRLARDATRPQPGQLEQPRIATLCKPFFSEDEVSALHRWWDMEPQNALGLAAVDADGLNRARQHIDGALDELKQSVPELHAEAVILVQDIVLARSGDARRMQFGGVSSFAAWGAIGINLSAHSNWVAFLKTIVHESAHLLLFAMARDEPLLLNDPAERHGSPLRDDARPLDGVFHAAFVSAREALALDACLSRHEESGVDGPSDSVDLLEQSLYESVLAFTDCCEQLERHARLTALGEAILQDCRRYMQETFEIRSGV
jgi:hypothetical protein